MATSQQKSKVAQTRLITDETAEAFADIIGKSISTLRSLESGRLKLSEKTASDISSATGVSFSWLMSEKNTDPIVGGVEPAEPFTKETYVHHTAKKRRSVFSKNVDNLFLLMPFSDIVYAICGATEIGKGDIALYYLEKFAKDLTKKFPAPKDERKAARKLMLLGESIEAGGCAHEDKLGGSNVPLPKPQKKRPSRKSKRPA